MTAILNLDTVPNYEDLLLSKMGSFPEVVEAHITNDHDLIVFAESKSLPAVDDLVTRIRALREVADTTVTYCVKAGKGALGTAKPGGLIAFVYATVQPGGEDETVKILSDDKAVRDVLLVTGKYDLLITAEIGKFEDMWSFVRKSVRPIRFLGTSLTRFSVKSWAKGSPAGSKG